MANSNTHCEPAGWTQVQKQGGIPNRLNYRIVFVLYAQFTNVIAGRKKQTGGPPAARGLEIPVLRFLRKLILI
jgi:hypothetical protein